MESNKSVLGQDTQTSNKLLSHKRSSSIKNKKSTNLSVSIVSSNNNNNHKPKSSSNVSSSRNIERKKSISGSSSSSTNTNINTTTTTVTNNSSNRNKNNNVTMKRPKSGMSDDVSSKQKLPPKLNLEFKNNHHSTNSSQQLSSKDKNSSTKISPSDDDVTPSLVSPKIIELRKSEIFHQSKHSTKENNNSVDDDDSLNVTTSSTISSSKKVKPSSFASNNMSPKSPVIKRRPSVLSSLPKPELNKELLARLEQQNSQLPPQDSTQFLLARLERQNDMLDNDPKSVCIESNVLKANMDVVQSLIDDIKSPTIEDLSSSSSTKKTKKLEDSNDDDDDEEEETKKIDWDFWTALIQDYTSVATKLPHLLDAKLQQGLPIKLRGLIWQSMSQASSTYLETMYGQLLSESSPYDKIIERDLARTFPAVDMFKEENGSGQTMLFNILKAYSLYDPLVGYCQGLGFLVGPLLMNMSETQAFCVFVRLMETYDMRTMFTLNMEGLQQRLYQFSSLLSQILPKLHAHFHLHGIQSAMYASQWFLSLFAYTYPLPLVFRIYDVVFAEGAPETIMRIAIALLKKNEEKLLEFGEFEDLLDFLTSRLYETYDNEPTGLIKDAMELSSVITKGKMDELSKTYVHEMEDQKKRAEELVKVRFNGRFKKDKKKDDLKRREKRSNEGGRSSQSLRHSIATMQNLESKKNSNKNIINSPVSSDLSSSSDNEETSTLHNQVLHQQIEELVTALSVLQKEHADVTEQLVNIKMEKMDLVNEVEELNNRLKEMGKTNKRMSIDSSMTLNNDEAFESGRSTRIASPFIPTEKDGYDHMKNFVNYIESKLGCDKDLLKSRRMSAPATSLTEYQLSLLMNNNNINDNDEPLSKDKSFGLVKEWNEQSKEQYSLELALTDELIQIKREKFELMSENQELVKKNSELENALENSYKVQKSVQDKNIFLRTEIERLEEETTQAIYEQNSLKEEIKAIKHIRIEHIRSNKENEQLKKELEIVETRLRQYEPNYSGNNDWVTTMEEIDEFISATTNTTNTPKTSRRVSFLNFFGSSSNVSKSGETPICSGENCAATKKCDELEKMLKHVKVLLVESEMARDQMRNQLDDLNSMLNGFGSLDVDDDDTIIQPIEEKEDPPLQQKSFKSEKRLSTSLASFFGASS